MLGFILGSSHFGKLPNLKLKMSLRSHKPESVDASCSVLAGSWMVSSMIPPLTRKHR